MLMVMLFLWFIVVAAVAIPATFVVIVNAVVVITAVYIGVAVKVVYQSLHHKKVAVLIHTKLYLPQTRTVHRDQDEKLQNEKKREKKFMMIEKNDKMFRKKGKNDEGNSVLLTAFELFWNVSTASRSIRSNRKC